MVPVPSWVVPSKNVTVPVGDPIEPVTLADKVKELDRKADPAEEARVTVAVGVVMVYTAVATALSLKPAAMATALTVLV